MEIPREEFENVTIGDIIESEPFREIRDAGGLPLALGKDASGKPVVADLTKMPHLLIGGATNSGKSVCMNACICSLLACMSPAQLNFIMIDPKMVELIGYNGIRHLERPVIKKWLRPSRVGVGHKKNGGSLQAAFRGEKAEHKKLQQMGQAKRERVNALLGHRHRRVSRLDGAVQR